MQELLTLAPWLVTGIVGVGGILRWVHDLRSNAEYRAAQERIVAAKDAQIAQAQETAKAKDATIEGLRVFNYADAAKQMSGQREVYEARLAEQGAAYKVLLEEAAKTSLTLSERAAEALPEPSPEISLSGQIVGSGHVSATLTPGEAMTATEMALVTLALEVIGTAGHYDGQSHYVLNNGDRVDVGPSESNDVPPVRDTLIAILKHNSILGPFSIAVVHDQLEAAEQKWRRIYPERPNPLN